MKTIVVATIATVLTLLLAGCASVQPIDPNVVHYKCYNKDAQYSHPYRLVELNQFEETLLVWNPKTPRVKIPYRYSGSEGSFYTAGWVFRNGSGRLYNHTFGDTYFCVKG
jgi:hypothetical protein